MTLATALLLGGCQCGPSVVEEAPLPVPEPPPVADAGSPTPIDPVTTPDAGPQYSGQWAGEACPEESFVFAADAGVPEGAFPFGLCIALRSLGGTAQLNGKPAPGEIDVKLESGDYEGRLRTLPDGAGHYHGRAMRSRYDVLKYHPSGIFPTHNGYQELGVADLTQDRTKDLDVRTHTLKGTVAMGGVPWLSVVTPPDVQLAAVGLPRAQSVSTTHTAGAYSVNLIEGAFSLLLSVPREALGETELVAFPVHSGVGFYADVDLDIAVVASQLEGQLLVDGQPYPRRQLQGYDYRIEYRRLGEVDPVARTFHTGGVADFRALVPSGKYGLFLDVESVPDRHFPSLLVNKQLAASADLTASTAAAFSLTTVALEGGITIDGQPVPTSPNYNAVFYLYAYGTQSEPWSMAYYEVPLETASFSLRAFPAQYYVGLWVDPFFHPELVEGWYIIDSAKNVFADTTLPVEIETSVLEGRLLIDGQPPPAGEVAGTVELQSSAGVYRRKLVPQSGGSFRVRVPKGIYDVDFTIEPKTFPQYASGRQRLLTNLNLQGSQTQDLVYDTVAFAGPLRVGGEQVPDTLPGAEVGLRLRRTAGNQRFTWSFDGGQPTYVLRVPSGDYQLTFVIEEGALSDVAYGTAPVGVKLSARPPQ